MSNASDSTRAISLKRRVDRTSASDYQDSICLDELSVNGRLKSGSRQEHLMSTQQGRNGVTAFDFFIGEWDVAHRRLKERLAGCDDNFLDLPGGAYRAITLRSYDPKSGQWSIWWLDGRYPGTLDTPMIGGFENGVGTFYANDTLAGRPIRVRFLWTLPKPDLPRWEQAFSADAGATWETNWVMEFTRRP